MRGKKGSERRAGEQEFRLDGLRRIGDMRVFERPMGREREDE